MERESTCSVELQVVLQNVIRQVPLNYKHHKITFRAEHHISIVGKSYTWGSFVIAVGLSDIQFQGFKMITIQDWQHVFTRTVSNVDLLITDYYCHNGFCMSQAISKNSTFSNSLSQPTFMKYQYP